ncbi:hypothetical protein [Streptomyces sp. TLI_171]|uniref:hypothetical protein n=1 Tax=Streptomyces sp. TLI_171 TaxID=1938859 RepID=UPI000C197812|nr:hypothetical protein [Streptomyces sp. TLI_171]RKE22689.1 hypothetical protein BX266_6139 [Streptomyces sp. TLI_171]
MEPIEREGGEPACFLNLVCEECGKVREGGRCPVCDVIGDTGAARPGTPGRPAAADQERAAGQV